MMPRGWKSGAKRARISSAAARPRGQRSSRADAPSSTSASTAIGVAPRTISGFTSTLRTSGRSAARRPRPTSSVHQRRLVDGGLAAEGRQQQPARAQAAQHPARLGRGDRSRREDHVAERFGEHAAQPEHHAGAELRILHQARDQLPAPAHHLAHQEAHLAVLGSRAGEQLFRRAAHRRIVREAEAHQAALRLVGDLRSA